MNYNIIVWGYNGILFVHSYILPKGNLFSGGSIEMKKSKTRILSAFTALTAAAAGIAGSVPQYFANAAYGVGGNGTSIMEYLDRGIYAVKSGSGMLVSWRFNADDADDAEFRLYRNDEMIFASTTGKATCFYDAGGSSSSEYRVDTIENGVIVSSEKCRFSSGSNYFDIPLDVPQGGVINGEAYSYSPNDCCVGDVDGDGQYEIFLKWDPSNSKDNSQVTDANKGIQGITGNVYIDCYTLSGQKLWRIDLGRNIRAGQHYTQMCVADFDCDGKAELITKTADGTVDGKGRVIGDANALYRSAAGTILSGPEYLSLFEGATGAALDTIDFPVPRGDATSNAAKSTWGDNYGNRCERYNSAIAYLDGVHPSAVYGRGYYTRLTLSAVDVVNGKLSKRWIYDTGFNSNDPGYGCGNHNVMVADVDNDGRQEICMGASMIDDNGKLLWSTKQMHGDAMHLGDLVPDREGLELWICHEDKPYGVSLVDAKNGQIIFHKDADKDTGRCAADNVTADNKGAELWGSRPAGVVLNTKGDTIGTKVPAMNFFIYWDGDLEREILDGNTITKMTSLNSINSIYTAEGCVSINGTKSVPCLTADIFGDWREELVLPTSDGKKLRVHCTTDTTNVRLTTLMHDAQYRMQAGCEQSSYNQPPHVSYYLGSDAPLPARPSVKLNKDVQKNTQPAEPLPEPELIKELSVFDDNTRASWSVNTKPEVGGAIFGDRDFTYVQLPDVLNSAEAIQTACDSKNSSGDLGSFVAGDDIDVYILLDQRVEAAGSVPEWLSSWEKTGLTADSSNDVRFDLYKKHFSSGDNVLLGTNGMTGYVINYTVFAVKAAAPVTTTTTVTTTETTTETTTTTAPPVQNIVWGDANCDGRVTLADSLAILQFIANEDKYPLTDQGIKNADVYNSGDGITANDSFSVQKFDCGAISTLPESFMNY